MAHTTTPSDPALATPVAEDARPKPVPPLENGDRLTRPEFERRYLAMPHVKKAELIEGMVHMPSPVRHRRHGQPHSNVMGWLWTYCTSTPGTDLSDNATVRLDMDNEPQPDALLRRERSGTSRLSEDDYLEGPPELAVEIASSSSSIDLHSKLQAYRRNGVQEYLIWQVLDEQITWLALREGRYHPLLADEHGIVRSQVFPGLWLDTRAMLAGDRQAVLATISRGLDSPEHAQFTAELAQTDRLPPPGPAASP